MIGVRALARPACLLGLALLAAGPAAAAGAPGDLDRTFSGDGTAFVGSDGDGILLFDVAVDSKGRVVAAGWRDSSGGANDFVESWVVTRFLPSGKPDEGFGGGDGVVELESAELGRAFGVALDSEGLIYIGGARGDGASRAFAVARFRPNGSPDATYGGHDGEPLGWALTDIDQEAGIQSLAIDGQDRIVAGGSYFTDDADEFTDSRLGIVRYTPTGDEDSSFDANGIQGSDFPATGGEVVIDSTGRLLLGGRGFAANAFIQRYLSTGADDANFGVAGTATVLGESPDVEALVALEDGAVAALLPATDAPSSSTELVLLDSSGDPDASFGGGDGRVELFTGGTPIYWGDMARDAAGRYLTAGGVDNEPDIEWGFTAGRYRASGAPDPSFGGDGISLFPSPDYTEYFRATVIEPTGQRLYAVGEENLTSRAVVARVQTQPTCGGRVPTIVGTSASDRLKGTSRADVIAGAAGRDKIRGLRGKDTICGGRARDKLKGGPGKDKLIGGPGRDKLIGGPGKDKLRQ